MALHLLLESPTAVRWLLNSNKVVDIVTEALNDSTIYVSAAAASLLVAIIAHQSEQIPNGSILAIDRVDDELARHQLSAQVLICGRLQAVFEERLSPDGDFDRKMAVLELIWKLIVSNNSNADAFIKCTDLVRLSGELLYDEDKLVRSKVLDILRLVVSTSRSPFALLAGSASFADQVCEESEALIRYVVAHFIRPALVGSVESMHLPQILHMLSSMDLLSRITGRFNDSAASSAVLRLHASFLAAFNTTNNESSWLSDDSDNDRKAMLNDFRELETAWSMWCSRWRSRIGRSMVRCVRPIIDGLYEVSTQKPTLISSALAPGILRALQALLHRSDLFEDATTSQKACDLFTLVASSAGSGGVIGEAFDYLVKALGQWNDNNRRYQALCKATKSLVCTSKKGLIGRRRLESLFDVVDGNLYSPRWDIREGTVQLISDLFRAFEDGGMDGNELEWNKQETAALLLKRFQDSEPAVRAAALTCFHECSSLRSAAVSEIVSAAISVSCIDPEAMVRRAAADVLVVTLNACTVTVKRIRPSLQSTGSPTPIRLAAIVQCCCEDVDVPSKLSQRVLTDLLADNDWEVQVRAVRLLGGLMRVGGSSGCSFAEAEPSETAADPDATAAVSGDQCAKCGRSLRNCFADMGGESMLLTALSDVSRVVRREAFLLLSAARDAAAITAPAYPPYPQAGVAHSAPSSAKRKHPSSAGVDGDDVDGVLSARLLGVDLSAADRSSRPERLYEEALDVDKALIQGSGSGGPIGELVPGRSVLDEEREEDEEDEAEPHMDCYDC
ncbi:armadillo-type protein [Zopfochytrium polystomum]|nr:armadillo-type protein [Zopfochytrium polystomum]